MARRLDSVRDDVRQTQTTQCNGHLGRYGFPGRSSDWQAEWTEIWGDWVGGKLSEVELSAAQDGKILVKART